jgi:hypothetical protein
MTRTNADQYVQSEVLEGLATAVNHRRWFVELAIPYLGATRQPASAERPDSAAP